MTSAQHITYPYQPITVHPFAMPYLNIWMVGDNDELQGPFRFLVDTGSLFSYAPKSWAIDVANLAGAKKESTGCFDLSGNPLDGYPADVGIVMPDPKGKPSEIVIKDRIFFRDEPMKYGVLGHQLFLKVVPAFFWTGKDKGLLKLHFK